MMYERHYCRLCNSRVEAKLKLNPTPIANSFPDKPMTGEIIPLELRECVSCQHVQIGHVVPDSVLYGASYKYETPAAQIPELDMQAQFLREIYPSARTVLEIGANNGLFVDSLYRAGFEAEGIDPSGSHDHVLKLPFTAKFAKHYPTTDIIVAKNVFAHIDDLNDVFNGIDKVLAEDGVLIFEVQYFLNMAERGEFDMIYHEHRDYHTLAPLVPFLAKHGLGMFHVERLPNHGGSIRIHCKRGDGMPIAEKTIDWDAFTSRVHTSCAALINEVENAKEQIILLGAPAKACTLIHQTGIADKIAYAVDNTPQKQGRYIAGTKIKILPEKTLMQSKSGKALLLAAWNYEDIFRKRYPDFDFIVPFKPRQRLAA